MILSSDIVIHLSQRNAIGFAKHSWLYFRSISKLIGKEGLQKIWGWDHNFHYFVSTVYRIEVMDYFGNGMPCLHAQTGHCLYADVLGRDWGINHVYTGEEQPSMTYSLGWKNSFLQPSTPVSPCKRGQNARVTQAKKTICHRLQNQKIKLTARLWIVY